MYTQSLRRLLTPENNGNSISDVSWETKRFKKKIEIK